MKKLTALALILLGSVLTFATVHALTLYFPDVDDNAYYAQPLSNMVLRGVIQGYGNGDFGPDDPVTRAQIVTMFDRYDKQVSNMKKVVCGGFKRENLSTDDPNYGDVMAVYDTLCGPTMLL